jgi:hypothetical protein
MIGKIAADANTAQTLIVIEIHLNEPCELSVMPTECYGVCWSGAPSRFFDCTA